jgi:hypothetical protein
MTDRSRQGSQVAIRAGSVVLTKQRELASSPGEQSRRVVLNTDGNMRLIDDEGGEFDPVTGAPP